MKQPENATKQDLAIIAKIEIKDKQYCPATKEELQVLIKYNDIALDTINTSAITDMSRLFIDAKATKRKDFSGINTWDTSNVTDMSYMFAGCERFNEELGADIPSTSLVGKLLKSSKKSRFITSNVTTMSHMFDGCSDFNKAVKLDTHNVTDMSSMFKDCIEFNSSLDLDTSNVVIMNRMFCTCRSFNQALNFNTKSVKDISYMFAWCRSFNQALNFNTENVENFAAFLSEATKFAQPFTLNTSKAKKLNYLLYATHFNHPITLDLASAENINYMFKNCSKLTHTPKLENLDNVKSAKGVFENCRALKDIPDMSAYNKEEPKSTSSEKKYKPTTKDELKELCDDESINLGDIDTSLITEMNGVFMCSKREDFSGIDTWDTSNVTNMSQMFRECKNFNQPLNFDTSNVTNMSFMFDSCSNFNQPLNFDTSSVTDMQYMFRGCKKFNQSLNFDTKNVTDMSSMFYGCENFNQPLNFDTSSVTDMSSMFSECKNFNQSLDFNTSNVTDMSSMFYGCENFNQPLNFNTSNVTDMGGMFNTCSAFNQPLKFDTSNVINMNNMFNYCPNFNQPLDFNTSNVTDMGSMFEDCSNLTYKPKFDMSNVEEKDFMFSGCDRLGSNDDIPDTPSESSDDKSMEDLGEELCNYLDLESRVIGVAVLKASSVDESDLELDGDMEIADFVWENSCVGGYEFDDDGIELDSGENIRFAIYEKTYSPDEYIVGCVKEQCWSNHNLSDIEGYNPDLLIGYGYSFTDELGIPANYIINGFVYLDEDTFKNYCKGIDEKVIKEVLDECNLNSIDEDEDARAYIFIRLFEKTGIEPSKKHVDYTSTDIIDASISTVEI